MARLVRARAAPVLAARFHVPAPAAIDLRLLGGAAIFGVGWGLSGYCPGPALVGAGAGTSATLGFVAALLAGTAITRLALRR